MIVVVIPIYEGLPSSSSSSVFSFSSISQSSSLTETLLRDFSPWLVTLLLSDSTPPSKVNSSGSARAEPAPYGISGISTVFAQYQSLIIYKCYVFFTI